MQNQLREEMKYKISKLAQLISAKSDVNKPDSWLPFWMHAQDTVGIIEKLVDRWVTHSVKAAINLTDKEIKQIARFIGMLHDIGKCTVLFTSKITRYSPRLKNMLHNNGINLDIEFLDPSASPHALVSQSILINKSCPKGIASIIGSHHGKPAAHSEDIKAHIEYYSWNCYGNQESVWQDLWNEFLEMGKAEAGIDDLTQLPVLSQPALVLFSGLLIMADWLASNTDFFPLIDIETNLIQSDSIYPNRVNEAWKRINLPKPWQPKTFTLNETEFKEVFGFAPNSIQKAVIDIANEQIEPGLIIIESPMGSGKTESALAAAQIYASRNGSGGVFLGLPTQATANGIFPRLIKWATMQSSAIENTVKLAHGAASLNSDYQAMLFKEKQNDDDTSSSLYVHPWFEGNKKSLLADFVVGTVDQLLLAALKQKHVMLKHLGLVGKIVIIDEVHSYDPFMNKYLDRMLHWLGKYKVSVILLSATLAENRRNSLLNAYIGNSTINGQDNTNDYSYPLVSWTNGKEICHKTIHETGSRLSVNCIPLEDTNIASFLHENLADGGCVGIVVNTVKKAQSLGKQLTLEFPDHKVIVFHSQFDSADRICIEQKLLKYLGKSSTPEHRNNLIIVGTQVIEQSLDIDFDLLLTDLCPMDLLLQRIGRMHRHPNRMRPARLSEAKCAILTSSDENLRANTLIYSKWLLNRTNMLFSNKITLPDDISKLVKETYRESFAPEELTQKQMSELDRYKEDCKKSYNNAEKYCIPSPGTSRIPTLNGWLDRSLSLNELSEATVRDSDPSVEVIPLKICEDNAARFVSTQNKDIVLRLTHNPSNEEFNLMLKHKIRLPRALTHGGIILRTISELENNNNRLLSQWRTDKKIAQELFLLFDTHNSYSLCGYKLTYDKDFGLICIKEQENG